MSWVTLGDDAHVLDSKDVMLLRKYFIFIQKDAISAPSRLGDQALIASLESHHFKWNQHFPK